MAVNSMDYSGKDTVLGVIKKERDRFFKIVDDPKNWKVQTRCEGWEVRDMVGHLIDVTEGYLARWDKAKKGDPATTVPLNTMASELNRVAMELRSLPRDEAIKRLKVAHQKMMPIFEGLTPEEWGGFNVTHGFMGPLPTFFYPAFHVMDYGVHTWDMNWGLGKKDAMLDEDTAGVLVPFMFVVYMSTLEPDSAKGVDITYGISIDGDWGGKWKITVKDGKFGYEPATDLSGLPAEFHYNHVSDFVLTAFGRGDYSHATGDKTVIQKAKGLFFRI
jgi:uncharacterized protein (TIGR03083 family)